MENKFSNHLCKAIVALFLLGGVACFTELPDRPRNLAATFPTYPRGSMLVEFDGPTNYRNTSIERAVIKVCEYMFSRECLSNDLENVKLFGNENYFYGLKKSVEYKITVYFMTTDQRKGKMVTRLYTVPDYYDANDNNNNDFSNSSPPSTGLSTTIVIIIAMAVFVPLKILIIVWRIRRCQRRFRPVPYGQMITPVVQPTTTVMVSHVSG